MTKNQIENKLKTFYERLKYMYENNCSDMALSEIFYLEDIQVEISSFYEELMCQFVIYRNIPSNKRCEIYTYEDEYDFLNSLTKIDINDIYINVSSEALKIFTMDVVNILNKLFQHWLINKSFAYRKGTKIFLEYKKDGIKLVCIPDVGTVPSDRAKAKAEPKENGNAKIIVNKLN
jgi:hypothetical protein